jgi:hypothetical protein
LVADAASVVTAAFAFAAASIDAAAGDWLLMLLICRLSTPGPLHDGSTIPVVITGILRN